MGAEAAVAETRENAPLAQPVGNTTFDMRQSGVMLVGRKWKNGRTITVAFDKPDSVISKRVRERFEYVESLVNLSFEYVRDWNAAEIRVAYDRGQGSWSYLGTDNLTIKPPEQTMNLGWVYDDTPDKEVDRVTIHEALHMLGMPHEHSHPEGGIPWDKPKVYEFYAGPPNHWDKAMVDHNVFYRYSETVTQFTDFDRHSIMAYSVPNELTIGDYWIGENTRPSERDVAFLAEQYPKIEAPAEPKTVGVTRFLRESAPITEEYRVTWRKRPYFDAHPPRGA